MLGSCVSSYVHKHTNTTDTHADGKRCTEGPFTTKTAVLGGPESPESGERAPE